MNNKERAMEMYIEIERRKEVEKRLELLKKKKLRDMLEVEGGQENAKNIGRFDIWNSYRVRSSR